MTDLYKNRYRISSARLQTWDYATNALYFVTICTADRECFFGDITDAETQCIASLHTALPTPVMRCNDLGKYVEAEWLRTPELRPDMNLELNEYVVMPNHFHGIIYIGENQYNSNNSQFTDIKNRFGPQRKNLASIIRGFKSAVTTYARKNDIPFNWQTRFHDHIITSHKEYLRIADYIIDNPAKWHDDKFYK